jgi:hypothetical protein
LSGLSQGFTPSFVLFNTISLLLFICLFKSRHWLLGAAVVDHHLHSSKPVMKSASIV